MTKVFTARFPSPKRLAELEKRLGPREPTVIDVFIGDQQVSEHPIPDDVVYDMEIEIEARHDALGNWPTVRVK